MNRPFFMGSWLRPAWSFWGLCALCGLWACSTPDQQAGAGISGWQRPYQPRYAKTFVVDTAKGLTRLVIRRRDAQEQVFVLAGRDQAVPSDAGQVIRVPVRSIAGTSTTQATLLRLAGRPEVLTGLAGTAYATDSLLRARIAQGQVREIGNGGELNIEALTALRPDILLTGSFGGMQEAQLGQLGGMGVITIPDAEPYEVHPLGRLEWVVLYGLLVGQDSMALALFDQIAQRYEALSAMARKASPQPEVMVSLPYKGVWYVSGGQSYAAKFLADAGARYCWAGDSTTGSITTDHETVLSRTRQARYWLHPGTVRSLAEIRAQDERLTLLPPFAQGEVWQCDRRRTEAGWIEYYETSIARPDEVLADLIHIFHPTLLPDRPLYYYQRLR